MRRAEMKIICERMHITSGESVNMMGRMSALFFLIPVHSHTRALLIDDLYTTYFFLRWPRLHLYALLFTALISGKNDTIDYSI